MSKAERCLVVEYPGHAPFRVGRVLGHCTTPKGAQRIAHREGNVAVVVLRPDGTWVTPLGKEWWPLRNAGEVVRDGGEVQE